jgi:hypothetical protein
MRSQRPARPHSRGGSLGSWPLATDRIENGAIPTSTCSKEESMMTTENSFAICNVNGKNINLWTNPGPSDFTYIPTRVRFTADRTTEAVYVWDYSWAMHTDMSMYLGLRDPYSSPDFLKGAAQRSSDGRFLMVESHFLQSFKRNRLPRGERLILENLLNQDWSWLDRHVVVTGWLKDFQIAMGISA